MNKLNPLYILVLVFTILLITFVKLGNIKEEYKLENSQFNSFDLKAKNYKDFKQTWFDKTKVEKKLDLLVKNSAFKNEKILKTQNSNVIKVKIESTSQKVLDKFLNRLLNEKFLIKKLDIKKRSILVEIGFK